MMDRQAASARSKILFQPAPGRSPARRAHSDKTAEQSSFRLRNRTTRRRSDSSSSSSCNSDSHNLFHMPLHALSLDAIKGDGAIHLPPLVLQHHHSDWSHGRRIRESRSLGPFVTPSTTSPAQGGCTCACNSDGGVGPRPRRKDRTQRSSAAAGKQPQQSCASQKGGRKGKVDGGKHGVSRAVPRRERTGEDRRTINGGGDTTHEQSPRLGSAMASGRTTSTEVAVQYTVPTGCAVTEFVGEGGANLVVGIELPDSATDETRKFFKGKLLRLQKESENSMKGPYPYKVQYEFWEKSVRPLFNEDELVSHDLVQLGPGHDIFEKVEALLAATEGRKERFKSSRIARAEHGILVEDMRVDQSEGIFFEFKPKWLLQSPSAPKDAVRCRTCAVELHRELRDPDRAKKEPPCPLQLVSDDRSDRAAYVRAKFPATDDWAAGPVRRWFGAGSTPDGEVTGTGPASLLLHLRDQQAKLDGVGPLGAKDGLGTGEEREAFALAMTLRDCSVFLRVLRGKEVEGRKGSVVEAKLADLDKKNAEAKMEGWYTTEKELVDHGAYVAAYRVEGGLVQASPARNRCILEKEKLAKEVNETDLQVGEARLLKKNSSRS